MSVLPSVWIMEMDLLNERTAAREETAFRTQPAIENTNVGNGTLRSKNVRYNSLKVPPQSQL